MQPGRATVAIAAVFMFVAVGAGAFGAHALRESIGPERLATWHTAVEYQAWHALALFGVGLWRMREDAPALLAWVARLFLLGMLLFSGSLYALVLTGTRALGAVTPLGGVAFLAGWVLLGAAAFRHPRASGDPRFPHPRE